jgi:hypothetical protein
MWMQQKEKNLSCMAGYLHCARRVLQLADQLRPARYPATVVVTVLAKLVQCCSCM